MKSKPIIYLLIAILSFSALGYFIIDMMNDVKLLKNKNKELIQQLKEENDSILNIVKKDNVLLRDSIKRIIRKDSVKIEDLKKSVEGLEKEKSGLVGAFKTLSNDSLLNLAIKRYEEAINN